MENELLKKAIEENGIKLTALADKMGISRQSLYLKLKGERTFDQGEIMSLKRLLNLSDRQFMTIFFGKRVEKFSTKERA